MTQRGTVVAPCVEPHARYGQNEIATQSPDGWIMVTMDRWTGRETRFLRHALRMSVRAFAEDLGVSPRTVSKWEAGGREHEPRPELQAALDTVLRRASEDDRERFGQAAGSVGLPRSGGSPGLADGELEALELARRLAASDVGAETLAALEEAVDELACDYPRTPPSELLSRVRRYLTYISQLLDARMSLTERRRLHAAGGWLSLLAATCEIDLGRRVSAEVRLRTAAHLAAEAGHKEITAWVLETRAWQHLTSGDFRRAVDLAQGAQAVGPKDGSAFIQATAQEGRAWARLGEAAETRHLLSRVEHLANPLPMPDRAEHHYRYDPAKSDAYHATTLAWLGDSAAEGYARGVLARLEAPEQGVARPRRAASARLDLSLALLAADRPDEAVHTALEAVLSGRLVPSNYWRVGEILTAVEVLQIPETAQLREAYRALVR